MGLSTGRLTARRGAAFGAILRMLPVLLTALVLTAGLLVPAARARWYELEDWVSYGVFRTVTSMGWDDEHIYIGTTGGVMRYDHWREEWSTPLTTSSGLPDNRVLDLVVDEDNREIVFFTRRGASRFDPFLERFRTAGDMPPVRPPDDFDYPELFPDFELNYYRTDGGAYLTDPFLRRFPLTARLADEWGHLWIGTAGLGAGRARLRSGRLKMMPFGLIGRNVNALAFDGDHLWVGGIAPWAEESGLTRAGRDLQDWKYYEARFLPGMDSDDVTAIVPDSADVWVGTLYGLCRYEKEDDDWTTLSTFQGLADDWVTDVALDGDILWAGTSRGLTRFIVDGDSISATQVPLVEWQKIYDIEVGPEFTWFGTEQGVYALDRAANRWLRFTSPDGTIERTCTAISVFGDEIWFGTTVGLTRYDSATRQWDWHPFGEQIRAGHIICLEAGPRAVWAGTETGLWKLRRRTGRWRVFTTEDGLLDNTVQAILVDGAYLWLGTPQGLTRFYWDNPLRID
jgi:ligand-binding sensor domain-containing protein